MLASRAAYILEGIEILLALPTCHLIAMLCVQVSWVHISVVQCLCNPEAPCTPLLTLLKLCTTEAPNRRFSWAVRQEDSSTFSDGSLTSSFQEYLDLSTVSHESRVPRKSKLLRVHDSIIAPHPWSYTSTT